jgi:hypothetical protein
MFCYVLNRRLRSPQKCLTLCTPLTATRSPQVHDDAWEWARRAELLVRCDHFPYIHPFFHSSLISNHTVEKLVTAAWNAHVELQRIAQGGWNLLGYAHEVKVLTGGISRNVLDSSDSVRLLWKLVSRTEWTLGLIAHWHVVLRRLWRRNWP